MLYIIYIIYLSLSDIFLLDFSLFSTAALPSPGPGEQEREMFPPFFSNVSNLYAYLFSRF